MRKILALLASFALTSPAFAGSLAVTPGAGVNLGTGTDGTNQIMAQVLCGAAASATLYATCTNQAVVNASGQILTLSTITGTVPLPTGAATSANQTSVIGTPGVAIPANGLLAGAWQPTTGFYENLIVDATQALKVGFSGAAQPVNATQQNGLALANPTAPGTPAVSGLVPTVNVANAGTASLAVFTPNTIIGPLAATTGGVTVAGLTAGQAIKAVNTGASSTTCSFGATNAGSSEYLAAGGGFFMDTVPAGITQLTCTASSGTNNINIMEGPGLGAGSGGGGGGSSNIPVTNAGTSATTASAVQGVTGGVPMNVNIGQSSGATVPISISTATTTQLVALAAGKAIYVTSWDVIAGGTGNITLEYGTGSNCGTGTTVLTGAYPLTAQTGISKGDGLGTILLVPSGNALCALTSAAVQMSGSMSYTQQ